MITDNASFAAKLPDAPRATGWLTRIERAGNALPDPVMLFVGMIVLLMIGSAIAAALGWSAVNPVTGELLVAKNLFGEELIRKIMVEMPRTLAAFLPLGVMMTLVIAAGVADHSGLLAALVRASLQRVPLRLLTSAVFIVGMLTTHAIDAGYVVYVPLAGVLYAAIGRHPVLGLVTAYCGCATGLSGNLLPGQYDVMILSITQVGAQMIEPDWTMNPMGNWYFSIGIALAFTLIASIVIDRVVAPRLGAWRRDDAAAARDSADAAAIVARERRGLRAAGVALLAVALLAVAMAVVPGWSPLYDRAATGIDRIKPLFGGIVALMFLIFVACGWAYGAATGTIAGHRDVIAMMRRGLEPVLGYFVLILFASQFVAMFGWSNLGPITAIAGAEQLRATGAPIALLLPMLATLSAWLDFLIASGSAKWTVMSPVATHMFMLLGVSPEMTTAAYRVGDTVTNLISPLNAYLVMTLMFAQRWVPQMRIGSMIALTLPIAIALYFAGIALTILWVAFGLPVGPGASVAYHLP